MSTLQLMAALLIAIPILAIGWFVHRRNAADRARLVDLIEQMPVAVALWQGPGRRCVATNAPYRALGELPELREALDHVHRTGAAVDVPQRVVSAGRSFTLALRATRGTGVLAVAVDVTAEVDATRALDASRAAADAASRAKDEFLAMLGHELRNPLAPILTALELMRLRPDHPNERERGVIERQTRHMMRLVDDMLDIARITRGKLELQRERADVAELIAHSIEVAAPLVEQRGHELVTEVQHNLVVDGDVARLVQVLANLVTNAAKYTDPGGKIRVTATRDRQHAVIAVRDTGRGIDATLIEHIFEMFTQEKQQLGRPHGGLGLGLAIVRSIVELHGGTVSAASDGPGTGSEFVVRLPLAPVTPTACAVAPPRDVAASQKPVVLLVDDNEDAASLLGDLLRSRGCVVHVAYDGSEALQRATELVPDVALLDIGLPEMDGYELARRLRALPAWSQVRLVALTGYGNDSDRERSSDAGFERHLVKPIDAATVFQIVYRGGDDAVPVAIN